MELPWDKGIQVQATKRRQSAEVTKLRLAWLPEAPLETILDIVVDVAVAAVPSVRRYVSGSCGRSCWMVKWGWFHCFSSVSWIVLIIIATTIAWIGTAQGLKLTRISVWIGTAVSILRLKRPCALLGTDSNCCSIAYHYKRWIEEWWTAQGWIV